MKDVDGIKDNFDLKLLFNSQPTQKLAYQIGASHEAADNVTYEHWWQIIQRWSSFFRQQGLHTQSITQNNSQKKIALYLPGGPAYATLFLTCVENQNIFFPLSPASPPEQISAILKKYHADALICDSIHIPFFKDQLPSFTLNDLDHSLIDQKVSSTNLQLPVSLLLSSGSTGEPKGIIHNFNSYLKSALGMLDFYQIAKNVSAPSYLASLPLNHIGGLMIPLRMLIAGGKTIYPSQNTTLSESILSTNPDYVSLVPTQLKRLLADNSNSMIPTLKKMRGLLLGGGPVEQSVLSTCNHLQIPISLTYGMTETCSQIVATPLPAISNFKGKILPNRQLQIHPETKEILVRGEVLFMGFYDYLNHSIKYRQEDFFGTKDRGELDNEGLTILGRLDDMFISGGENIDPLEIENLLLTHPDVQEVKVIPFPHEEFGRIPVVVMLINPLKINPGEMHFRQFLKAKIPAYKIPKLWRFATSTLYPEGRKPERNQLIAKYFSL